MSFMREFGGLSKGCNHQQLFKISKLIFYKKMVDFMITINENLCKGCNICTEFCPRKVYKESGIRNKKGVQVPVPENEDKCTQCQLCAMMCPDQAIRVDEKVDEKDEN